jgi:hypothetical protein
MSSGLTRGWDTGSRKENASNQKAKVFHRFREAVKDSRKKLPGR